ncbi:MAG: C1 family peptidase [Cyanobacteria bacterium P01_A01_bin.84]
MDDKTKKKSSFDYQAKGLGWIPDYPDYRDYIQDKNLANQLRVKAEGNTNNFEELADVIIYLLNTQESPSNTEFINKITGRIFGNISFAKVIVHKLLRDQYEYSELLPSNQYELNKVSYESILSNQIRDLKQYLLVFLLQIQNRHNGINTSNNQANTSETEELEKAIKSQDYAWITKWTRSTDFDINTKGLIKIFQTNIQEIIKKPSKNSNDLDIEAEKGRVGINTYTILNSSFIALLSEKDKNDIVLPDIQPLSIASLIPNEAFERILYKLKSIALEQIEEASSNEVIFENDFIETFFKNENKHQIFEYFFEYFFQDKLKNNNKETLSLENKFDSLFKEDPLLNDDKFFQKIQDKLYIIEPIISFLTQLLSPLSQHNNEPLENLIEIGLLKFGEALKCKENQESNFELSSHLLATQALNKTIYYLINEMREIIKLNNRQFKNKIEKEEQINTRLLFYFLLIKYVQSTSSDIESLKEIISTNNPNIFDKQEFFQIDSVLSNQKISSTKDEQLLLENINLYIPLSKYSYVPQPNDSDAGKGFGKDSKNRYESKKSYFYFFLPGVIDLSFWFNPVKDQGKLNSCTAFAATSLLEYFVNRNSNENMELSSLFLYKAARNKMDLQGDIGASIRETMKALTLFGVPPEKSWTYDEDKVDEEPPSYCYAYADNFRTLKYFLLDYAGISTEALLFQVKAVLATGFPCIFGFTIYDSAYAEWNEEGHIPFPNHQRDKVVGGHTVVAVGYDNYKIIRCADRKKYSKGALLIRNSWGTDWGVNGYGWLPYDYVLSGLTGAWWSLLKAEWFDENNFGLAKPGGGADPTIKDTGTNTGTNTNP